MKQVDDDYFCGGFQQELEVCDICGSMMIKTAAIVDYDEQMHLICGNCAENFHSCRTCYCRSCAFGSDPSPIPKMVQKQFRQGNMITVTEVLNPERIRVTCQNPKNPCPCFDNENGCLRQNTYCGNHNVVYHS